MSGHGEGVMKMWRIGRWGAGGMMP
jgi:hypothetical protein